MRIFVLDEYSQRKSKISISRLFHAGDAIMAPDTPMDETSEILRLVVRSEISSHPKGCAALAMSY